MKEVYNNKQQGVGIQRPSNSPRSILGNQVSMQLLSSPPIVHSPPVIQRVPELWEVALMQAINKLKHHCCIYKSQDLPFETIVKYPGLYMIIGISENIFSNPPKEGNRNKCYNYFLTAIKDYFGKGNGNSNFSSHGLGSDAPTTPKSVKEEMLLGSLLDNEQFNGGILQSISYLSQALNTVLSPSSSYLFAPPNSSAKAESTAQPRNSIRQTFLSPTFDQKGPVKKKLIIQRPWPLPRISIYRMNYPFLTEL